MTVSVTASAAATAIAIAFRTFCVQVVAPLDAEEVEGRGRIHMMIRGWRSAFNMGARCACEASVMGEVPAATCVRTVSSCGSCRAGHQHFGHRSDDRAGEAGAGLRHTCTGGARRQRLSSCDGVRRRSASRLSIAVTLHTGRTELTEGLAALVSSGCQGTSVHHSLRSGKVNSLRSQI